VETIHVDYRLRARTFGVRGTGKALDLAFEAIQISSYIPKKHGRMKSILIILTAVFGSSDILLSQTTDPDSLFEPIWLDIGSYHNIYSSAGAKPASQTIPKGMEYPAIMRYSNHEMGNGFWVGVKDWTDPTGQDHPFYVSKIGPLLLKNRDSFPVLHRLVSRFEDSVVEVDGVVLDHKATPIDEIDFSLASDRMVHSYYNLPSGISVNQKVHAYSNTYHDNYHIISYNYCNTGNVNADDDIELPGQTLKGVYFFRTHRWSGNEQAAWNGRADQVWGRYTMYDAVGDGHENYPVDFTAQYSWIGHRIGSATSYDNFGEPLFSDHSDVVAEGDSVGRLSGATMAGRAVIHADRSGSDNSHDSDQPRTMSWIDPDVFYRDSGLPNDTLDAQQYYEYRILSEHVPKPDYAACNSTTNCSDSR